MATKKRPTGSSTNPAIEITVEVPTGAQKPKVQRLIQAALRQVWTDTDVLETGELMVLRTQHDGQVQAQRGVVAGEQPALTAKPSKTKA